MQRNDWGNIIVLIDKTVIFLWIIAANGLKTDSLSLFAFKYQNLAFARVIGCLFVCFVTDCLRAQNKCIFSWSLPNINSFPVINHWKIGKFSCAQQNMPCGIASKSNKHFFNIKRKCIYFYWCFVFGIDLIKMKREECIELSPFCIVTFECSTEYNKHQNVNKERKKRIEIPLKRIDCNVET